MGGELEQELRDFFGALDRIELEPLVERITDDMQGVDEDLPRLDPRQERVRGQDYTYEGAAQHVSAPTTVGFRRVDSGWRMAVFTRSRSRSS